MEESRDLWKINQEDNSYAQNETAQTLEELLDDLENQNLITPEEKAIIEETGQVTIGSRTITFKENGLKDYLKIGDYVDYHPDVVTTLYEFEKSYTGSYNYSIGQDSNLQWRILTVNEDTNTLELISDKCQYISEYLTFYWVGGYTNGVALLNDYCKTMYSNTLNGAVARSLNIEDIQDKMKIDTTTGKKAYENYTSATGTLYNTTYSYSDAKWYPLQWKKDNGVKGESEPKNPNSSDFIPESPRPVAQETTNDLTVTQTNWELSLDEMRSNFKIANTRDITKLNSMYHELFFSGHYFHLASRSVDTDDSSCAYFGLRTAGDMGIWGKNCFPSTNPSSYGFATVGDGPGIRPVVSLPINAINLNTDYDNSGKWFLKF